MKLIFNHDDIEQYLDISKGESTIGRSSQATYTIRNDTISKVHTKFYVDGGVVEVEDLGSSNGTFVNGVKISKVKLKPTDSLKIGKINFKIEFSEEELKAFDSLNTDTPAPDENATPIGVETVTDDNLGSASETFFDASKMSSNVPAMASPQGVAPGGMPIGAPQSKAKGNALLANRKMLLTATGGAAVLLLMVIVLTNIGKDNKRGGGPVKGGNINTKSINEYEQAIVAGTKILLDQPAKAKETFQGALKHVTNQNTLNSLIRLSEILILSNKDWLKIDRMEFRRVVDDIRLEDEGQPGAILYDFVNEMTRIEGEQKIIEESYAKFKSFLEKLFFNEAEKQILEIKAGTTLRAKAESEFKATKIQLIDRLKEEVHLAREADAVQEEMRKINMLLKYIPASDALDYRTRLNVIKSEMKKDKLWSEANTHYNNGELDKAESICKLFEREDENYNQAQEMLEKIKHEVLKKNVQFFYDQSGNADMAIKLIDQSYSAKFLDLKSKIQDVKRTYEDGLRIGTENPDDERAHGLMKKVLELEPNTDNAYHKKASELLNEWLDSNEKCKRIYAIAQEQIKTLDYAGARESLYQIEEIRKDFNVTSVSKVITKYVAGELNKHVRNAKSLEIKRQNLERLSKMVKRGDKDFDFIQEELMKLR